MGKFQDLRGKRFGRLVALEPCGRDKQGYVIWRCKCDCGNIKEASTKNLGNGTASCGCYSKELHSAMLKTHGGAKSRLYRMYRTMFGRCTNPNAHEYENYGGRGITVCDEWSDFAPFREWALANGYDENAKRGQCTLDRIDPNKGYSPDNCRFVNMKTQQRNRRNNVLITYNGETHCMSEWAEKAGVRYGTFLKRIYAGWSMDRALQPVNR